MDRRSLGKEGTRSLLTNRQFCRLAGGQFVATVAVYGLGLAGVVLVEGRTQSSAQTGLVIISSILPAFLGSLVAGAVVDRLGRVRMLLASHLARALVALAFWAGTRWLPTNLALGTVYMVNAAGAAFSQFAMASELALLPNLVAADVLVPANGLLQLGMLAGEGLGIVLVAPLVIKLTSAPAVGLVSGSLLLLGLVLVVALPRERPSPSQDVQPMMGWASLRAELRAGWGTISRDRVLALVTIQATVAAALLLVLLSLVPTMASQYLGLSAEDTPFLMLPGGLGFVLGIAMVSRWQKRLSRPAWITLGFIGLGGSMGLLALLIGNGQGGAGVLVSVLAVILVVGFSLSMVIIPARVVLQERPPAAVRGRVIAAQLALANAAVVLPLLIGGLLADSFGVRPVMAVLGLLALGSGGIGLRQGLG